MKPIHCILLSVCCGLSVGSAPTPTGTQTSPPASQSATFAAGDLELGLRAVPGGVQLARLFDRGAQQDLLATKPLPLFSVTLRHAATHKEMLLVADAGWRQALWQTNSNGFEMRWENPQNDTLKGVTVLVGARAEPTLSGWHWRLRVETTNTAWSVWRTVFPQVALAELGEDAAVLFPRGPGEVQRQVWRRSFSYHGSYPGGWCAMQFMAAYCEHEKYNGLYVAVHDPWGSAKNLALESDPGTRTVRMRFEHPAPDMGKAGNGFELSGEAVWQVFRGDWYDAARLYKQWVSKEARWWPQLTTEGRADTPRWMRELNAWALANGAPAECRPAVEGFQQFLGVPIGFHWYNWHQIPFDNDYPHYFPAKEGFARAVGEMQRSNVFVMPYINGRLWDSHDRGAVDFEFSRRALPAATKDEEGKPSLESYDSKETNGQPVRLAAMCPATAFWQQTVSNLVLKLLQEVGTRAVYIDQVAAAPPALCQDPSHGHPLGGGHWWNEGYWQMLDSIRRVKPGDAMLTTECNGEPFVRWFDGYLTWHWQQDGQVPAFPAVYGGAVQMFGRAYRGGATKDLALRMKAGQQLVFGEQLGWISPAITNEKKNAEFLRQLVRLRARLCRYFYAGEMVRPPKFTEQLPTVKADWQWSGEWWVTTDAVLTGAWQILPERRLVLVFVNVSDTPVSAELPFDSAAYGVSGRQLHARTITSEDDTLDPRPWANSFKRTMTLAAARAEAWEVRW